MERKPSGQDGEICIYRLLNQQKYYLALSGNQVKVGLDQYFWTIERAKSPVFYLYVEHIILLIFIPHGI